MKWSEVREREREQWESAKTLLCFGYERFDDVRESENGKCEGWRGEYRLRVQPKIKCGLGVGTLAAHVSGRCWLFCWIGRVPMNEYEHEYDSCLGKIIILIISTRPVIDRVQYGCE